MAVPAGTADDSAYLNVWVHYDYMVAPDHSDAPSAAAIRMVVDAFKAHGVALHVDPQHTAIPVHAVIVPDWPYSVGTEPGFDDPACTGPDAVLFSALRATYFHPSSNHAWHYAVFGEHVFTDDAADANHCPPLDNGAPPAPTMTGYSDLGFSNPNSATFGYSFVVTLHNGSLDSTNSTRRRGTGSRPARSCTSSVTTSASTTVELPAPTTTRSTTTSPTTSAS